MSAIICCDLCREIIKPNDRKYIFAYYVVTETDEETRKSQFEEIIKAIYSGKYNYANEDIKVVEICEQCVGIFSKFMMLRHEDLAKSKKAVKKLLELKSKQEEKKNKEKK